MSSLPLPPQVGGRRSGASPYTSPATSPMKALNMNRSGSSGLPPPPNITSQNHQPQSNYAQNLARSMTIEEMRQLHRRALSEAEAKQTELRLVLASRYRELVGSSDEVTKMRERAQELHELVNALPNLTEKLFQSSTETHYEQETKADDDEAKQEGKEDYAKVLSLRLDLSKLPRLVHRALDKNDVHEAADCLMQLFRLIAEQTDEYPLATALSPGVTSTLSKSTDTLLKAQMRMTFLHVQTLPAKITRISKHILNSAASFGMENDPKYGAQKSASALSTLDLLDIHQQRDRPVQLLDRYFDSKAKLLQSLLNKLSASNTGKDDEETDVGANNAEVILSKIVLILQYDVILHPYQIFVLRKFPSLLTSVSTSEAIMKTLPIFPASVVQNKASKFLAAHLPLIRTKVKSVLVDIAGTTASALGKIRQSLYDKTDGLECMERLDSSGVCTWEEAVGGIVDVQSVLNSSHGVGGGPMAFVDSSVDSSASDRKFSLWSVLFSNTFSSLVHSLLTTSFHSVHTKVVSSLRLSLANAPPLSSMLPHEAYRNTLFIASELDTALLKVTDDAHELLVHAEERVESERRLHQSLYVQTCEIMGRLICELRRMLLLADNSGAVKELIVGRLCHLLKFRLTGLPTLLDPNSSPAVLHGTSGMISLLELSSAFDLADDDDDGLITFQEAMEAVDSAFSGTQFHGAEMVRETLLLPAPGEKDRATATAGLNTKAVTPQDVTLDELTLLLARGLRHEKSGRQSALGTIQESLDQIISSCFQKWAKESLSPYSKTLSNHVKDFVHTASTCPEEEYRRMYAHSESSFPLVSASSAVVTNVSPHIIGFLLDVSFIFNRSISPSDSLLPVPSTEYAAAMGIEGTEIPQMMDTIRWALLSQGLDAIVSLLDEHVGSAMDGGEVSLKNSGPSGLTQLKNDLSFIQRCFFERNTHGFGNRGIENQSKEKLGKLCRNSDTLVRRICDANTLSQIDDKQKHVLDVCDLFLASLFGEGASSSVPLGDLGDIGSLTAPVGGSSANPLLHTPLPSSCRFSLLPIQADRTLSGVQARGKYKDRDESENRHGNVGTGAVRAGLGFFSSMLKKN